MTLEFNSYYKFLSSNICLLPLKSNATIYVIDCRRFKSIVNQNINSFLVDKIQFEYPLYYEKDRIFKSCFSSIFQAAVRSSRRKRNQYVVDLRQNVDELKRRKKEGMEQNNLLRTLTVLWERLCSEVIIFSDFELIYLNNARSSLITRVHFSNILDFTGRGRAEGRYQ